METPTNSVSNSDDLQLQEIEDSLAAVEYFGAGLDGNEHNHSTLRRQFHQNPLKWCQIINFLIQIHYDMGHPSLKPNVISLCAEYLAYLTNAGYLNELFKKDKEDRNDEDIRRNMDIRMALFEAVKYDQGFQMDIVNLFDLNYYPKAMVFSNTKSMYDAIMSGKENQFSIYHDVDKQKNGLIDWLRIKEMEFCSKIDWKFSFSTRYQTLMIYLKRLQFDTDCIVSQQYKNVKIVYNKLRVQHRTFSNEIKFGFLCRYLLEMSYYKPDFYSYSKSDLIIGIIYSAYIIAQRWKETFDIDELLGSQNDLYEVLDHKHPINDAEIHNVIKKIIRIGRTPHSCFTYCNPIYYSDPDTNITTHYHTCKCILNCCLNTYLKYSKIAFCGISKMPCLSTTNVTKFAEYYDHKVRANNEETITNTNTARDDASSQPIVCARSNESVFNLSH